MAKPENLETSESASLPAAQESDYSVSSNLLPGVSPIEISEEEDLGLALYRDYMTKDLIIDFFTDISGDQDIAELILYYSHANDISPALTFSLCWAESSFRRDAVNENSKSVDRGLFQLNSNSFPHLSQDDFFDPEINVKTGIEYLKYCIDAGENEITGLAFYNAGRNRVSNGGTPRMTLTYINKIFEYRSKIEKELEASLFVSRSVLKSEYTSNSIRYVLTDEGASNRLNVW